MKAMSKLWIALVVGVAVMAVSPFMGWSVNAKFPCFVECGRRGGRAIYT
jgi:hypothetical protein